MYLRDLAASLLRRWYLVAVAALLVAGAGWGALTKVSPTYEMSASVVLVPPKSTEDPSANRFLALSGLNQAVSVVIRSLNSDQTNAKVDKIEPHGEYEATPDFTTSAPIVVLTADSDSPVTTRRLLDAVRGQVSTNLAALQEALNIKPGSQITPIEVSHDDKATTLQKKRIRLVAALTVLLSLMCAGGIGAVDGILMRRRIDAERKERASKKAVTEGSDAQARHRPDKPDPDTPRGRPSRRSTPPQMLETPPRLVSSRLTQPGSDAATTREVRVDGGNEVGDGRVVS